MTSQRKTGTILSYILMGVNLLTSLIYTPIMLRILGQSEYGLYQLCYSVISYLSILNLGFTSSYMRFYSRLNVRDDEEGIARLNGMYMLIFLVISAITVVAGCWMVLNARTIFGIGLTERELETARILMSFMVFNMAISFPLSAFTSILVSHEKFIIQRSIAIIIKLLNPFLTFPLLVLGYGSVGLVVVTTILTVADFFAESFFCLKKLHARFVFKDFHFDMFKELGTFTFWIFLMNIVGQINGNVDKLLLGRMVNTSAVAVYGIGNTIYQMYQYSPSIFANIFAPQVNRLVACADQENEVSDLFIKVGRIQYLVLALLLTGFTFFGKAFIFYWSGTEYKDSFYVALLLMYSATIPFIQNLGIEIQTAKNKHQMRAIVYAVIAVMNVTISIPMIQFYGAVGATIGTAISLILGNTIFMNIYYQKKIGLDIISFWKNIGAMSKPLVLPIGFGILYCSFIDIYGGLGGFAGGILLYTCVYVVTVWKFSMNSYEKNLVRSSVYKCMENLKKRRMV